MEEGTILSWRVKPGGRVKKGDVIFEAETDKAAIEVEAVDSGRLSRIVANEGDVVPVLQPVAYLAENDADVDALLAAHGGAPVAGEEVEKQSPRSEPSPGPAAMTIVSPAAGVSVSGRVKASPAARKIAKERGVDLRSAGQGTGPGGRIVSTDLSGAPAGAKAPSADGPVRRRVSPMRKAIARNLLASKQTIPHFYMRMTIDADAMMSFYRAEKAKYPCTVNDVVAMAVARAVREFPAFRSRIEKDEIVEHPSANIGIAVGLDDGLVVPVVIGADRMSLKELAAQTKRLAESARGGKVEGMGQGVFTITNLGMLGVEEFAAIINPPEGAILAVGAVREDAVVRSGTVRPGRVMTLTLSADHRLIDGVLAAKFLARLKGLLESPESLRS